jgi:hypothetical protein
MKDAHGGEQTTTADISAHGIAVPVERMRLLRQYVELEITLPNGDQRVCVTAMVVRIIDRVELSNGRSGRGLGLDFFLFDARAKNEWQRFIQDLRTEANELPSTLPSAPVLEREDGAEPSSTFLVRPRDLPRLWAFYRREMEKGLVRIETPVPKQVDEPVEILVVHPTTLAEWCLQGKVMRSVDRRSGRPVLEIGLVALDEATRDEFRAFVSSGEGMIQEEIALGTEVPVNETLARTGSDASPPPPAPPATFEKVPTADLVIDPPDTRPGSEIVDLDEVVSDSELVVPVDPLGEDDVKTVNVTPTPVYAAHPEPPSPAKAQPPPPPPKSGPPEKSLSGKLFSSFFFEAAESQKKPRSTIYGTGVTPPGASKSSPSLEVKLGSLAAKSATPPTDPRIAGVVARPTPVLPDRILDTGSDPQLEGLVVRAPPSKPEASKSGATRIAPTRTPPPLPPQRPVPSRSTPSKPVSHPNIEEASTGAHREVSTAGTDPNLDRDIAIARARVVRSPNSVTACYRLGTLLLRRGDLHGFGEAIDTLERVMQLEPNHPGAHHAVAVALAKRGEYASAADHLQRARRLGYQVDPELERTVAEGRRVPSTVDG